MLNIATVGHLLTARPKYQPMSVTECFTVIDTEQKVAHGGSKTIFGPATLDACNRFIEETIDKRLREGGKIFARPEQQRKKTMKEQINLIKFLLKYPGKWHSFADNAATVGTVCATSNLGILELNVHQQMKLKSPIKAQDFLNAKE